MCKPCIMNASMGNEIIRWSLDDVFKIWQRKKSSTYSTLHLHYKPKVCGHLIIISISGSYERSRMSLYAGNFPTLELSIPNLFQHDYAPVHIARSIKTRFANDALEDLHKLLTSTLLSTFRSIYCTPTSILHYT